MLDPPTNVTDQQVLVAVVEHWASRAVEISHLPVGFGAHHWRVRGHDTDLFVTLDTLLPRHTAASLEHAYATAVDLAGQGLEFVLAGVRSRSGSLTIPLGSGALSVVPWHDGQPAGDGTHGSAADADAWASRLARLHAADPLPDIPRWRPVVTDSLAAHIASMLAETWPEPFGETAGRALRERLPAIERWVSAYHRTAARSDPASWVVTHGEPHTRNILRTHKGDLLVDWESVKLAPRERDFATLLRAGTGWLPTYGIRAPDWETVEMFDLEWRLDEISQYAEWFRQPHTGTASDREALDGLLHELSRPEWSRPG